MTVYTNTARFDSGRALTEDELRKLAPSVFATAAHESRSERFQPIPTIEIVRGLANEGFSVVGARQATARLPGKADFTKHLLRIRRLDDDTKHRVGDTVFEMLLRNANDGTASYNLMGGLFRIACLNSLVAKVATLDQINVTHSGKPDVVQGKVIEGTYRVLEEANRVLEAPRNWSGITLSAGEKSAFAHSAKLLRFESKVDQATGVEHEHRIDAERLLVPKREQDKGNDLWTVTNVVQEHLIRGGDRYFSRGGQVNGRYTAQRRLETKPVNGIDDSVKVNKALWLLAEKMAELKGVKAAA